MGLLIEPTHMEDKDEEQENEKEDESRRWRVQSRGSKSIRSNAQRNAWWHDVMPARDLEPMSRATFANARKCDVRGCSVHTTPSVAADCYQLLSQLRRDAKRNCQRQEASCKRAESRANSHHCDRQGIGGHILRMRTPDWLTAHVVDVGFDAMRMVVLRSVSFVMTPPALRQSKKKTCQNSTLSFLMSEHPKQVSLFFEATHCMSSEVIDNL